MKFKLVILICICSTQSLWGMFESPQSVSTEPKHSTFVSAEATVALANPLLSTKQSQKTDKPVQRPQKTPKKHRRDEPNGPFVSVQMYSNNKPPGRNGKGDYHRRLKHQRPDRRHRGGKRSKGRKHNNKSKQSQKNDRNCKSKKTSNSIWEKIENWFGRKNNSEQRMPPPHKIVRRPKFGRKFGHYQGMWKKIKEYVRMEIDSNSHFQGRSRFGRKIWNRNSTWEFNSTHFANYTANLTAGSSYTEFSPSKWRRRSWGRNDWRSESMGGHHMRRGPWSRHNMRNGPWGVHHLGRGPWGRNDWRHGPWGGHHMRRGPRGRHNMKRGPWGRNDWRSGPISHRPNFHNCGNNRTNDSHHNWNFDNSSFWNDNRTYNNWNSSNSSDNSSIKLSDNLNGFFNYSSTGLNFTLFSTFILDQLYSPDNTTRFSNDTLNNTMQLLNQTVFTLPNKILLLKNDSSTNMTITDCRYYLTEFIYSSPSDLQEVWHLRSDLAQALIAEYLIKVRRVSVCYNQLGLNQGLESCTSPKQQIVFSNYWGVFESVSRTDYSFAVGVFEKMVNVLQSMDGCF